MTAPQVNVSGRRPDRLVATFGWAGLIPFWAPLAVALAAPLYAGWALEVQAVYAGLILSFLGGARFGRAFTTPGGGRTVALSMAPSVFGLAVLASPVSHAAGHLMLAAALSAAWLWDLSATDLPRQYKLLRSALTSLAVAALVTGAIILHLRTAV